jgi:hypothetical protein
LDESTLYHELKLARLLELISKRRIFGQVEHVSEGIRKFSRNRDRLAENSVIFRARPVMISRHAGCNCFDEFLGLDTACLPGHTGGDAELVSFFA